MRSAAFLSVLSTFVAAAAASDAPVVTSNPANVTYVATILPTSNAINGDLTISTGPDGVGTSGVLKLDDLPESGPSVGPFTYHIHVNPVNSSGSCASTGGHLDPYNVGKTPCDPAKPASCEVGDLAGKFGSIEGSDDTVSFTDKYTSLEPGTPAFIGNRSVVIHAADGSRIACANFVLLNSGNGGVTASPTRTGGVASPTNGTGNGGVVSPTITAAPTATPTGGAVKLTQSVIGLLGLLAVGVALL